MAAADKAGCAIVLPVDVVVADGIQGRRRSQTVAVDAVPADEMILDVGPKSIAVVNAWIDKAATLVWNGPLGAFEMPPFDKATVAAARHAAERTKAGKLLSVAGGGDTVAALNQAGVADDFSFVSTAGGAFLEWLEGKAAPRRRGAAQALISLVLRDRVGTLRSAATRPWRQRSRSIVNKPGLSAMASVEAPKHSG